MLLGSANIFPICWHYHISAGSASHISAVTGCGCKVQATKIKSMSPETGPVQKENHLPTSISEWGRVPQTLPGVKNYSYLLLCWKVIFVAFYHGTSPSFTTIWGISQIFVQRPNRRKSKLLVTSSWRSFHPPLPQERQMKCIELIVGGRDETADKRYFIKPSREVAW